MRSEVADCVSVTAVMLWPTSLHGSRYRNASTEVLPDSESGMDWCGCADSRQEGDWERLASQDSPFREQITWSLITVLGRPALPDIQQSVLVELLVKKLAPAKES